MGGKINVFCRSSSRRRPILDERAYPLGDPIRLAGRLGGNPIRVLQHRDTKPDSCCYLIPVTKTEVVIEQYVHDTQRREQSGGGGTTNGRNPTQKGDGE